MGKIVGAIPGCDDEGNARLAWMRSAAIGVVIEPSVKSDELIFSKGDCFPKSLDGFEFFEGVAPKGARFNFFGRGDLGKSTIPPPSFTCVGPTWYTELHTMFADSHSGSFEST